MLKTILRKELLENIHSCRFPLFALICVFLIPLGEALKANAASIGALLFWLIAPFAFAYVRFLKSDVR
jgi:hypothetical protein